MLVISSQVSLLPFNTFGIDVRSERFSIIDSPDALWFVNERKEALGPLLPLGGGSNILFTSDVPYWTLHNRIGGIEQLHETEEHVWLRAGGGESWHGFVRYCVDHGYGGVENLSLIPGTVGAAPIQNIGAYGAEVANVIEEVTYFDFREGGFKTIGKAGCAFGYRDSIFKNELKGRTFITNVTFKLDKKPRFNIGYGSIEQELANMGIEQLSIDAISRAVMNIRNAKLPDPKRVGNAGSFFKNPEIPEARYQALRQEHPTIVGYPVPHEGLVKVPAAWLIEQCGWKGTDRGTYGVHKNQALVLVNLGHAKGSDIARLSEEIKRSVHERFGILLQTEVQIL